MMKTIKLSNASHPLAEYAKELNEDTVVGTNRDRGKMAIKIAGGKHSYDFDYTLAEAP